jgi:hypothetical protein
MKQKNLKNNLDNLEKKIIDLSQVRLVVIFGIFTILFLTLFLRSVDLILLNNKSNELSKSILPPDK